MQNKRVKVIDVPVECKCPECGTMHIRGYKTTTDHIDRKRPKRWLCIYCEQKAVAAWNLLVGISNRDTTKGKP